MRAPLDYQPNSVWVRKFAQTIKLCRRVDNATRNLYTYLIRIADGQLYWTRHLKTQFHTLETYYTTPFNVALKRCLGLQAIYTSTVFDYVDL